MKQLEDTKTIDMIDQVKRGRGRPPVEKPLTPAERAKRYRENKAKSKALMNECQKPWTGDPGVWLGNRDAEPVTKKTDQVFMLECKISSLELELESWKKAHQVQVEANDIARAEVQYAETAQQNIDQQQDHIEDLRNQVHQLRGHADFLAGMVEMFIHHRLKQICMDQDMFSDIVESYHLAVSEMASGK